MLVVCPPICAGLARLVITLLTLGLGGPRFVDATLGDLHALLAEVRDVTLPQLAAEMPELQLSFFDGAAALGELAAAAAEGGVVSTASPRRVPPPDAAHALLARRPPPWPWCTAARCALRLAGWHRGRHSAPLLSPRLV